MRDSCGSEAPFEDAQDNPDGELIVVGAGCQSQQEAERLAERDSGTSLASIHRSDEAS